MRTILELVKRKAVLYSCTAVPRKAVVCFSNDSLAARAARADQITSCWCFLVTVLLAQVKIATRRRIYFVSFSGFKRKG